MTVNGGAPFEARWGTRLRRLGPRGDEALVEQAARGDASAFGAVYERHHRALYRYCRSILGHHEDALDAVNTTMVKAWEALLRGRPNAPLRPWLYRIAHNEAITVLRRRHVHACLDEAHPDRSSSPDEALDTRQRLVTLRADLAALPERQRNALLLRELCGLRHDEIAHVLAISPAVARQTIYEARVGLHEAEAGREMACMAVRHVLSDGDGRGRRARRIRSHLRACRSCSSFEATLRRRPKDLAGLVPPLPGAASASLLARLLGGHGASGAGWTGGAEGVVTGVSGATSATPNLVAVIAATAAAGTIVATGLGTAGAIRDDLRAAPVRPITRAGSGPGRGGAVVPVVAPTARGLQPGGAISGAPPLARVAQRPRPSFSHGAGDAKAKLAERASPLVAPSPGDPAGLGAAPARRIADPQVQRAARSAPETAHLPPVGPTAPRPAKRPTVTERPSSGRRPSRGPVLTNAPEPSKTLPSGRPGRPSSAPDSTSAPHPSGGTRPTPARDDVAVRPSRPVDAPPRDVHSAAGSPVAAGQAQRGPTTGYAAAAPVGGDGLSRGAASPLQAAREPEQPASGGRLAAASRPAVLSADRLPPANGGT
jgi:RNA polymerase sigma factor (sigma-70 family)